MSVWIICDANPDCDNHLELATSDFKVADLGLGIPHGWTGTPWDAHCPLHPDVPF